MRACSAFTSYGFGVASLSLRSARASASRASRWTPSFFESSSTFCMTALTAAGLFVANVASDTNGRRGGLFFHGRVIQARLDGLESEEVADFGETTEDLALLVRPPGDRQAGGQHPGCLRFRTRGAEAAHADIAAESEHLLGVAGRALDDTQKVGCRRGVRPLGQCADGGVLDLRVIVIQRRAHGDQ